MVTVTVAYETSSIIWISDLFDLDKNVNNICLVLLVRNAFLSLRAQHVLAFIFGFLLREIWDQKDTFEHIFVGSKLKYKNIS